MLEEASAEIDYLRCEVDHLRESYDALVSNSSAEHRLDEENVQQRRTIEYWMGCFERREDDYQRLYSQAEDIKEQYRDCASALAAEQRHHAAARAEVLALANERRDANKIARDLTACRSELASIAILMQERNQLPDMGGENFALLAGAVTTYVLALELAVVALNQEGDRLRDMVPGEWDKCREDLERKLYEREEECRELCDRIDRQAEQIGGLNNLLACDDDCYHAPMCVRWEHSDDTFDADCRFTLRDETGAPMIVSEGAKWPNDPNIT